MNKIKYILGFVFLAGCSSDPFVGKWEAELDAKADLTIDEESSDQYSGRGHLYYANVLCPFEMDGHKIDESNLTVNFHFYKTGNTCVDGSVSAVQCTLINDNDRLKCQVPGGTMLVYNKSE